MALAEADIAQIKSLVEQMIADRPELANANVRYELDLRERTVKIEEELKHQRELMIQGFNLMEKRFEQVDKRLDQVDKQLGQVDKRLDQVDKQLGQVDRRFDQVDKRFEQFDKHFETMRTDMNTGFMEMNRRLDRFMYWTLGLVVSGVVFTVNFF